MFPRVLFFHTSPSSGDHRSSAMPAKPQGMRSTHQTTSGLAISLFSSRMTDQTTEGKWTPPCLGLSQAFCGHVDTRTALRGPGVRRPSCSTHCPSSAPHTACATCVCRRRATTMTAEDKGHKGWSHLSCPAAARARMGVTCMDFNDQYCVVCPLYK